MVGSLCWLGPVLEFNKMAFIKQILFLSKQNWSRLPCARRLRHGAPPARQPRAYEWGTTWHAGLFSVDDLFAPADTLVDAGVAHWAMTAEQVERLPSSLQRLLSLKAVTQPRLANSPIDFARF
jgi:hypothetical protein